MTHFITSSQDHDHITSSNDAIWDAGTIGFGQFAIKAYQEDTPFTCSMPDPNTLRIGKGQASCDGYRWEIEGDFEDVVIENGTPGYNRIDLVVADITTAPKPDCKLIVLKGEETAGEPVAPEPLTGDLNHGDTHVQMPIRSVKLTGINPEIMDASMNVLVPYAEFRDSQSHLVKEKVVTGSTNVYGNLSLGLKASEVTIVQAFTHIKNVLIHAYNDDYYATVYDEAVNSYVANTRVSITIRYIQN